MRRRTIGKWPAAFVALISSTILIAQETPELDDRTSPPIVHGHYRFSFDEIELPEHERLGLLGGNYLFDSPAGYLGLGIYSAVTGRRGGFFTGGFEFGHVWDIASHWQLDAGFFAGGGGGGGAPQGGGLMLRPHVDVSRHRGANGFGLGVSRVTFPNGRIASSQVSLQWRRDFTSFLRPGWDVGDKDELRVSRQAFAEHATLAQKNVELHMLRYFPDSNQTGRGGVRHNQPFDVLGIRFRQQVVGNWWGQLATAGALGGGADGYAEIFTGVVYEIDCIRVITCFAGGQIGAAGGGDVATGGGVVARLVTGASLHRRPWSLGIDLAYAHSLEGGFKAPAVALNAGYSYDSLLPAPKGQVALQSLLGVEWVNYRVRSAAKKYVTMSATSRKQISGEKESVDLVSLKLDAFINPRFFATGQAEGAYSGKAGGYATGLLGLGARFPLAGVPAIFYGGEVLVGAAGGGGISVGGGVIAQPMLNFAVDFSPSLGFELGVGYVAAREGQLRSVVADIALAYRIQAPRVKRGAQASDN